MADIINQIYEVFAFWGHNLKTNITLSFTNMDTQGYIRMVAIVGAYLLIRPYLMKLGAKAQGRQHEKEIDPSKMASSNGKKAKISANSLRGQVEILDDSDEDEEEGKATATEMNWGKKARKRQRQMIKKVLETGEKKKMDEQESEDDKEMEEWLLRNCRAAA